MAQIPLYPLLEIKEAPSGEPNKESDADHPA